MVTSDKQPGGPASNRRNKPDLSPAAERALAEAEQRRIAKTGKQPKKELGGRKGPDPIRFGDWENKGIASDF